MKSVDFDHFINDVKENLLGKNQPQEKCGIREDYWTADMWTLGVAECLNIGEKNYDPQNRMHKIYKRDLIIAARFKVSMIKNLEKIKDTADFLFVGEVGRGLDILIAESLKEWNLIYCYDHVNYNNYLKNYFGESIKFIQSQTHVFNISQIKENCIMLLNINTTTEVTTLVKRMGDDIQKYLCNSKIKHLILNGEIIK